ncbi:MAG: glutamate formimidoyltransferase [Bryobacteraceae bacterium]|nr:glutamate formimidoyltransferase [Bryobacteraceae bacterium]MDW8379795.1 glutamate formimidoyltransferase [Bryobacterales bacterium]
MRPLIECVPNFSEGRDRAVIEAIVNAANTVAQATVLDYQSDPDHHRCVVTLAGRPEAVEEAAFRAVAEAVRRIDLNRHRGAHPRIGAADVAPFVPVRGVTMKDCVDLAHRFGRRVWQELNVPVYFYEYAALSEDRRKLERVRQGQFEELRKQALECPERRPDVGGPALHPTAGALAVGARKYLLAFNVNLATSDLSVADRVARRVRESSGGLPHVKAMAVWLASKGVVQVSMNLTDFDVTPLHTVFLAVQQEAARLGVEIAGSEIIGLIPAAALAQSGAQFLKCENYSEDVLLERQLLTKVLD